MCKINLTLCWKKILFFFLLISVAATNQNVRSQHVHNHSHDDSGEQAAFTKVAETLWPRVAVAIKDTVVASTGMSSMDYTLYCFYYKGTLQADKMEFFEKAKDGLINRFNYKDYIKEKSANYISSFDLFLRNKSKIKSDFDLAQIESNNTTLAAGDACTNIDFEQGSTNGWVGWTGYACTSADPCSLVSGFSPSKHFIVNSGNDPIVGAALPMVCPGGAYSLRLEDHSTGGYAARISQTFLVSSTNSNFTYKYAVVLEDPGNDHSDPERPYFKVRVKDQNGNLLNCGQYSVSAKPPIVDFLRVGSSNYYYRNWTTVSIPLAAYIGQNITIEFTASDCALSGHLGYAYIDGSCFPLKITSSSGTICSDTAKLSAPSGFTAYSWSGPGIITSPTQQSVSVNQPGTYVVTLTSSAGPNCTTKLTHILTPTPNLDAGRDTSICAGNSIQLEATGGSSQYTWTPATGLSNANIYNPVASPTTTTTYRVSSCGAVDSVKITVTPGFTLNAPDVKPCKSGFPVLEVRPSVPGTYTYLWTPNANLTNFNTPNATANISTNATYNVLVTNSSGCSRTESVDVIFDNTAWINKFGAQAVNDAISLCQGQSTLLNAGEEVFADKFDPMGSWSSIAGGIASNTCGSVTGNALYFNGSPNRYAQTYGLNVLTGGSISFYLKMDTGTAPCDDVDPDEDVVLEYSLNSGITWTTIDTLFESAYPTFSYVCLPIPTAAQSASTVFRWRQISNSGTGQDNWSLDNIKIIKSLSSLFSYTWTPAAGLSATNIASPVANPGSTTKYYVSAVHNNTGCSFRDSVTLNVVTSFTSSSSNDTSICKGNSAQIWASATPGNYTYLWSPASGLSNTSIANPIATPTSTRTYSVDIISPGGCKKTETVRVTVDNTFDNSLKADAEPNVLCLGQTSQLSEGNLIFSESFDPINVNRWSYYYPSYSNSCGSVSGNAMLFNYSGVRYLQTVNQNVSLGGNISFYLKIANGSSSCDDAEVGEDVVLEFSTNSGTTWTTIATYNEASYPNFTYITTSIPVAARTNATMFRWRQISNSGTGQDVWALDNIKIVRNLNAAIQYSWTPAGTLSDPAISNPAAQPTITTNYVVTITNPSSGCSYKDSIEVVVAPTFNLFAGNDTIICKNNSVSLNPIVSPAGAYTYSWTPATSLSSDVIRNPIATPLINTSYVVTALHSGGCRKQDTITISLSGEAPQFNISATKNLVCKGETIQLISSITNTSNCGLSSSPCVGNQHTSSVGTGSYGASYPFTGSYHDAKTQFLYTRAELLAAGIVAGESIRSLEFNIYSKGSSIPYSNFTVKMSCTSLNQFSSGTFQAVSDIVYTPKTYSTILGWNVITFDNPYIWDGNSNLIVEICYDNSNYTSNDNVYADYTTFYSLVYYYGYNSSGCNYTSGYYTSLRPNIRFNSCSAANTNFTYSWLPSAGLSNPSSQTTSAVVSNSTNYILTASNGNCITSKSVSVRLDSSYALRATFDTTCTSGVPVPLKAIVTSLTTNSNLNCGPGNAPSTPGTAYTIGTGSSSTYIGPFYGYSHDARMQYIIPASELLASGMSMGVITQLDLNIISKSSFIPFSNFTVKLSCVSNTSFTNASWLPSGTIVFGPTNYNTYTGWNGLKFSTPYNWDGVSSILVEICYDNTTTSAYDYIAYTTQSYTSTLFNYADNSSGCNLGAGYMYSYRPNMRFVIKPSVAPTFTYSWTPTTGLASSTSDSTGASPAVDTWYKVVVSGGNCALVDSVLLIPNQLPMVTISPSTCQADSIQLSSTGGTSYQWSPSLGLSNTQIANPKADPLITTKYYVNVINNLGCSKRDSVTIYRGFNPTLSNDTTICSADTIRLVATGAPIYAWTPVSGLVNPAASQQAVSPASSTKYYVTFSTQDLSCHAIDSVMVNVSPLPNLVVTNDTYLCIGDSLQLNASGGATYQWSPSTAMNGATTSTPKVAPTNSIKYYVLSRTSFGCSAYDSVMVDVKQLPIVSKSADVSVCDGNFANLMINGGLPTSVPAVWNPGNLTGSSVNVNPSSTTMYVVRFGDQYCMNSDSIEVTVFSNPVVTVSKDTSICLGQTVQLFSNGGTSYSWNPSGSLDDYLAQNPISSATTDTEYIVTAENNDGCTATDTINVIVIQKYALNAFTDGTTICNKDTIQLFATGGGTYTWRPQTNLIDPNVQNPLAIITGDEIYTVYSSNRCFADSAKVTIIANPLPIANAGRDTTICFGGHAQLVGNLNPAYTYSWTPTRTLNAPTIYNPVATPKSTTDYILEVSNGICKNAYDTVTVNVLDEISFNLTPSVFDGKIPLTIDFSNSSSGGANYMWVFGDGDTSYVSNPSHSYTKPGNYTVTIYGYNSLGCVSQTNFDILAYDFMIPNLITPNGDGKNESFEISSISNQWRFEVYNRWGHVIYQKDNYRNEWNGEGLADGIYYFMIKDLKSGEEYRGWVQITR